MPSCGRSPMTLRSTVLVLLLETRCDGYRAGSCARPEEFAQLPGAGDNVYGFAAGHYPTDHPTLPDADVEGTDGDAERI